MSQTSGLPGYSALYAFGDSLSDAGNLSIATKVFGATTPVSPPYYQEQYGTTTGNVFSNGPTWVQDLSLTLGLGTLAPSLTGGTDFAYGGAETGPTPQNAGDPEIQAISLPAQLVQFETAVPHPAANALYTLSIGANDLLSILADTGLSAQQQTADVTDAVANEVSFVNDLVKDGAKNLLVLDVPDLGKTPDVMDGLANGSNTPSAAFDAEASQLTAAYNTDLSNQLNSIASTDSIDVHVIDAYKLVNDAVADPAAFGLANVTTPVWSGSYSVAGSGTLAATSPAVQDTYLFWDHLHPTETGEKLLAAAGADELAGLPPPCYAAGTHIATARGEVMVQHLRVGDRVRLAEGGTAPIRWLGHRRVTCRRHPRPADVQPVRIAAHAFGLGRPHRDLLLSPDHAVFVDGVLIPVRYLLNDATVRQEDVARVTYWHIELPSHGIVLAEGMPAETYLDTGNRAAFVNGGSVVMAHPDFARAVWRRAGYAKLVTAGAVRDVVCRRLVAQGLALGWRPADAGAGRCHWLPPRVPRFDVPPIAAASG
jgi:phospholipase/lecithinase/hemolysin